ncbi:MAG: ABC transporter substrate-binding protein [Chthoniobacterales bacterium]|nr:ABC transporter substrate-binding protein [Chthoniobacterales bacterium]MBA3762932.1 ABC transporter substrate-binding protein [Chthoniobacterales bacterium]
MKPFARLALLTLPLVLAAAVPLPAQEIVVGQYASLTGSEATFGINSSNGVALALDEINNGGGVLGGRKIKIITEDDQSKAGQPSSAVKKLISSDKVIAVVGEISSSRSLEAAPICQEAKIPMVSPGATNARVTEVGDYIFRVCFIDPFQGTVMAKFALDNLKATKIAILTDVRNDYSVGLTQYFKEYFESHGGKVVTERSFSGGGTDRDFRAQLTSIKAAQPDAVFVPGYYTEAGLIAKQARSLGIKVPLLGGDGWDSPKLSEIGGSAIEGSYFSTHFSPKDTNPKVQDFVKRYQAKFNAMPDGMAPLGYDAMMVLAQALNAAGGTEGPKVRDALAAVKEFDGVTGKITIDGKRNATKAAVVLKVGGQGKGNDFVASVAP